MLEGVGLKARVTLRGKFFGLVGTVKSFNPPNVTIEFPKEVFPYQQKLREGVEPIVEFPEQFVETLPSATSTTLK
jgi:hypothetical protein